jgi:hypothetical protein
MIERCVSHRLAAAFGGTQSGVSHDDFIARFGACFWEELIAAKRAAADSKAGDIASARGDAHASETRVASGITVTATPLSKATAARASALAAALRASAVRYRPEDEAVLMRTDVLGTALAVVTAGHVRPILAAAYHDAMAVLSRVVPQLLGQRPLHKDGGTADAADAAATRAVEVLVAAAHASIVVPERSGIERTPPAVDPSVTWLLPLGAPPLVLAGYDAKIEEACIVAPHPALDAHGFSFGLAIYIPTGACALGVRLARWMRHN